MRIETFSIKGRRDNQEDNLGVFGNTIVISDGMGGHAAGELASQDVVDAIGRQPDNITDAFREADRTCLVRGDWSGATALAVKISEDEHAAEWYHVGDSRLYLIRANTCKQVTQDQGIGHMLLNCIGGGTGTSYIADGHLDLEAGDILVLVTDGISDVLEPEDIYAVVASSSSLSRAEALCICAYEAKSADNCTAIIIYLES